MFALLTPAVVRADDRAADKTIAELAMANPDFSTLVTALKARWNKDTSHAIERAGGHGAWVLRHLHGDVLHDIEYQDGPSPMHQIALRKGAPA